MSGIRLTISITDNASAPLREYALRVADTLPLMKNLGEIALASVQENFEVGGRPKWQPLAPATIKAKGHSKPLVASGVLKNVVMKATASEVTVGVQPSAKAYAAIQHFGGKTGRGGYQRSVAQAFNANIDVSGSVTIPARPYMLLQDEDLQEIDELVQTWPADAEKNV